MNVTRRNFLIGSSMIGLSGLAGCASDDPTDLDLNEDMPDETPTFTYIPNENATIQAGTTAEISSTEFLVQLIAFNYVDSVWAVARPIKENSNELQTTTDEIITTWSQSQQVTTSDLETYGAREGSVFRNKAADEGGVGVECILTFDELKSSSFVVNIYGSLSDEDSDLVQLLGTYHIQL